MAKKITLKELLTTEGIEEKMKELSFEDGLAVLEELVEKVEGGNLALEQSVLSYEKGTLLIERLRSLLEGAEKKLKSLN